MAARLSEVHESARRSMKEVFMALWPKVEHIPEDMAVLAEHLRKARRRIQAWKVFACREGAREAWAMVKTRYTKVETAHLAEVGPKGPDGEEIPTSLAYANVMPAARFLQKDCALDTLIDGLDRM
jgi:hypothetical protein